VHYVELPVATALFVGAVADQGYFGQLKKLSASYGLSASVQFVGWREDIAPFLRKCDVLVVASTSEGLPHVVREAMLGGLPVVSTAVGAVPDVIQPGVGGWLVPPNEPSSLAEAIIEALKNPQKARLLAEEAHRRGRELFNFES
jgi:glycosyltransferase involved in cell wall biosynthesis